MQLQCRVIEKAVISAEDVQGLFASEGKTETAQCLLMLLLGLLLSRTPACPSTDMMLNSSPAPWSDSAGQTPSQDSFLKKAAGLSIYVQL